MIELPNNKCHATCLAALQIESGSTSDAPRWVFQSRIRILPYAVVGDRTFTAQTATRDGEVWIAKNSRHRILAHFNNDAATVLAVLGTIRTNFLRHGGLLAVELRDIFSKNILHGFVADPLRKP
jgi:hypothetical protein